MQSKNEDASPMSSWLRLFPVIALALPSPSLAYAPGPQPPPQRLALLVGVGTYPGNMPPDLAGPVNDIALVRSLFLNRFAFPAENIVTLVDAEATHAAIIETFRSHLIANARPGAEVVFWYSGHGSRIVDRSRREPDGSDNSLVAYDSRSRSPDGGYDVSDDELYTLLQELAAITDRVVVVTDSCHSQSSMRGGEEPAEREGVRYASRGNVPLDLELAAPLWKDADLLDDDAPARQPIADRFVHVSACMRWQLAAECEIDGRPYGLLTWFLVRALERAQPGVTWRQVIEQVQLLVREKRSAQTPTFDGLVDREVLGGRFVAPPPGIPTHKAPAGARGYDLVVEGGELTGLMIGSELRVLPFYGKESLGLAKIIELPPGGVLAHARWSPPVPEIEHGQPLRSLEIARPARAPRLPVAVPRAGFVAALGLEPWLIEVPEAEADYVLEPAVGPAGFAMRTSEGVPVWPTTRGAPKGVEVTAASVAENAVRFRALARLPLQPGSCRVSVQFVPPAAGDIGFGNYEVAAIERSDGNQWQVELREANGSEVAKQLAVLEITNRGIGPVNFTVVSLEESGCRRNAIWGYTDQDSMRLDAGASRRVSVLLSHPVDWPLPRPMRDSYIVLATPEPVHVERLIAWGHSAQRSDDVRLPWVLVGAFAANRTRSAGLDPEEAPISWGTAWLDLHVR